MRGGTSIFRFLSGSFLLLALTALSCSDPSPKKNGNVSDSKKSDSTKSSTTETPADAKPMGAAAPGFYTIGEDADAVLKFTTPQDGQVITGNSIAPTFSITGFPIYKDVERNRGQSVHIVLDNQAYYSAYNPNEPFKPADGTFDNLKEGLHLLRAFPVREWHESIKKEDGSCFSLVTFYVKSKSGATIDRTKPLLPYSKPEGEYRW